MAGVNKVILIGNVGKDPEVRYSKDGMAIANVTIATSEKVKGEDKTEWHRVVFFGKLAEIVNDYVAKGKQIYVEGKIRTRKWTDKEGKERYTTEIFGEEMVMLGRKGDAPAGRGGGKSEPGGEPPASGGGDDYTPAPPGGTDEDIPF